jgi:hypothetical protein
VETPLQGFSSRRQKDGLFVGLLFPQHKANWELTCVS